MSRYTEEELFRLLQAQVAAVLTYTAAVARRMDLGLTEIAALEHLQGVGALTPTELGGRLALSSGTVTGLIDRLERGGFVERAPNPRDRRSSVVRPTRAGAERALQHLAPLGVEIQVLAGALSPDEREVVGRYFEVLTDAITRHARGPQVPQG